MIQIQELPKPLLPLPAASQGWEHQEISNESLKNLIFPAGLWEMLHSCDDFQAGHSPVWSGFFGFFEKICFVPSFSLTWCWRGAGPRLEFTSGNGVGCPEISRAGGILPRALVKHTGEFLRVSGDL